MLGKVCINRTVMILLLLTGSIAYFNSLDVPFYFDDQDNILHADLRMDKLTLDSIKRVVTGGLLDTRPVSNLSFALNYYVGGYKVQGYHILNIVIHILSAYFLFLFVQLTLRFIQCEDTVKNSVLATATALIWMLHPTATQSVTYVVQRMTSMAAMFYILSMLLYAYGRWLHTSKLDRKENIFQICLIYLACLISALLAIGSKEMSATLPFSIMLYEWLFVQNLNRYWLKKGGKIFFVCLLIVFICAWMYTDGDILERTILGFGNRDFTLEERMYTQLRVLVYYISLYLYPHPSRLTLDYDFPLSTSIFNPVTTFGAGIFLISLIVLGVALAKEKRIYSFCIFWFFITLLIESSIVPLEIIFEHRLYLPSMMMCLFLVIGLYDLFRKINVVAIATCCLCILLGGWTFERNKIWQDPLLFWEDAVSKTPEDTRVHANLGITYFELKQYEKAKGEFAKMLELGEKKAYAYNGLGLIASRHMNPYKAELYFKNALEEDPEYALSLENISKLLYQQHRYDEAINYLEQLYDIGKKNNETVKMLAMLGESYLHMNRVEDAESIFKSGLKLDKMNVDILNGYARVLSQKGHLQEALKYCKKSLDINSDQVDINYNTGVLLSRLGDTDNAERFFKNAIDNKGKNIPVNYGYANHLLEKGEIDQAEHAYKKFIAQKDLIADAMNNLGLIYVSRNKMHDAVIYFKQALSLNGGHRQAADNLDLAENILSQNGGDGKKS